MGRNNKPLTRTSMFLGYKYTEEEKLEMVDALKKYKEKNNCTTTEAIYKLLTKKKLKK